MAMFNMAALDRQREMMSQKPYEGFGGGEGNWSFNILKPGALAPGNYRLRFIWPDPSKNPSGAVLVSTHAIEHDVTQTTKDTRVLTPESIANDYEKCHLLTDIIDKIAAANALERIKAQSKALGRVCDKLKPYRRWWIPVMIQAVEIPAKKEGEYSTFSPGGPEAPWLDKTLEINCNVKLCEVIFGAWRAHPGCAHHETGNDFILIKKNKQSYELKPMSPSPLPAERIKFISDEYPDLIEKMRKWFFKEPEEIVSMVHTSWWGAPGDPNKKPSEDDTAGPFAKMGLKMRPAPRQPPVVIGEEVPAG